MGQEQLWARVMGRVNALPRGLAKAGIASPGPRVRNEAGRGGLRNPGSSRCSVLGVPEPRARPAPPGPAQGILCARPHTHTLTPLANFASVPECLPPDVMASGGRPLGGAQGTEVQPLGGIGALVSRDTREGISARRHSVKARPRIRRTPAAGAQRLAP